MRNNHAREQRKQNIYNQRQRVYLENIFARDQQKQNMAYMNVVAEQDAQELTRQRDDQAARVYIDKRNAKKKHVEDYTRSLIEVRHNCEQRSLASLQHCDAIQERIVDLENDEHVLMEDLSNTMRQTSILLNDLSKKSISLSNQVVSRNPVAHKNKRLPGHAQYSIQKVDHYQARADYQQKLLAKLNQH